MRGEKNVPVMKWLLRSFHTFGKHTNTHTQAHTHTLMLVFFFALCLLPLKHRWYRLSCLPFVWYFFSLRHTHTHTCMRSQTSTRPHKEICTCTVSHTNTNTCAQTHKDKSIKLSEKKKTRLVYLLSGRLRKPKEPVWRDSSKMILRAVACRELLRTDHLRIRCASGLSGVQDINGNPRHCRQITIPHT